MEQCLRRLFFFDFVLIIPRTDIAVVGLVRRIDACIVLRGTGKRLRCGLPSCREDLDRIYLLFRRSFFGILGELGLRVRS